MRIICFLRTVWYTLRLGYLYGAYVSGHDYQEQDDHSLKCRVCGQVAKGKVSYER